MCEIKNRDATSRYKGFRYQKIRLAVKMLELLKQDTSANIVAIPEYKDDGFFVDKDGKHILEQNKEYSNEFTLNSDEIKKSIVNFIDHYLESEFSKSIHFVFFTNVKYKKEGNSGIIREIGLPLLDKPALEYLESKKFNDESIRFISKFIIKAYRNDYEIDDNNTKKYTNNYKKILKMTDEEWKIFFNSIDFQFGEPNLEKLEKDIEESIRMCEFFNEDLLDKIETIKAKILDNIDMKMTQSDWIQRIVSRDTIRVIFLECRSKNNELKLDNSYKIWSKIDSEFKDNTYRNFEQKIRAVSPAISNNKIDEYNLSVTMGNLDVEDLAKKNEQALRVRIYRSMREYFSTKFKQKESYSEKEIKEIIQEIQDYVVEEIEDLKKDYDYGLKNKMIINEIVLMLIDECFYSFDCNYS